MSKLSSFARAGMYPRQETTWNDPNDPLAASATPLHEFVAAFDRDIDFCLAHLSRDNAGGTTVFNIKIEGTTILSGGALTVADLVRDSGDVVPTTTAWNKGEILTIETVSSAGGSAKATVVVVWRERQ